MQKTNIEEELTAAFVRIIKESYTKAHNIYLHFSRKEIPRKETWLSRNFVWSTNLSEGQASEANYLNALMCTPPRSFKLLIKSHQKQLKKLNRQIHTSHSKYEILTIIGWNCMHYLRGQEYPDPDNYLFDRNHDPKIGLKMLTCQFTTKECNSENWSTLITYSHSSGSKYQVLCGIHSAYTI